MPRAESPRPELAGPDQCAHSRDAVLQPLCGLLRSQHLDTVSAHYRPRSSAAVGGGTKDWGGPDGTLDPPQCMDNSLDQSDHLAGCVAARRESIVAFRAACSSIFRTVEGSLKGSVAYRSRSELLLSENSPIR